MVLDDIFCQVHQKPAQEATCRTSPVIIEEQSTGCPANPAFASKQAHLQVGTLFFYYYSLLNQVSYFVSCIQTVQIQLGNMTTWKK